MTDKEILQGIDKLEDGIPFDEIRNGDKWLDIHELLYEVRERINFWHYPSKGELPKEGDKYLVVLFKDDEEPHIAEVKDGWFKHPVFSEYLCPCDSDTVFAWQYIVPPKEEA